MTEPWNSAQGEAKTVELEPSGFDVKSFPRQSRSFGSAVATTYKFILALSSHSLQTLISWLCRHQLFHSTTRCIFFCLFRPPPNRQNNLTESMFTEQLPDLLDYINNLTGLVCLVGDMNIHFDNPLQSLNNQTLTSLSLHSLVHFNNKPNHMCGHIIHWTVAWPNDDIPRKSNVTDSLESDHYCINPTSMFQSLGHLSYAGLLGRLLTLTVQHLLQSVPVIQNFHPLKRRSSTVNLFPLCYTCMHPLICGMLYITTSFHGLIQ